MESVSFNSATQPPISQAVVFQRVPQDLAVQRRDYPESVGGESSATIELYAPLRTPSQVVITEIASKRNEPAVSRPPCDFFKKAVVQKLAYMQTIIAVLLIVLESMAIISTSVNRYDNSIKYLSVVVVASFLSWLTVLKYNSKLFIVVVALQLFSFLYGASLIFQEYSMKQGPMSAYRKVILVNMIAVSFMAGGIFALLLWLRKRKSLGGPGQEGTA